MASNGGNGGAGLRLAISDRAKMNSFHAFNMHRNKYVKWRAKAKEDKAFYMDFGYGNPQEKPIEAFVKALLKPLQKALEPDAPITTFEYQPHDPDKSKIISDVLYERRKFRFEPEDIFLCNAALSGLTCLITTLLNPGDEFIGVIPSYFFYGAMADVTCTKRVLVKCKENFDLDVDAIQAAITPKTKAIVINSPNNPCGVIYQPETLTKLASMLEEENKKRETPIMIVSDEAYHRIIFDGETYHSPTEYYKYSVLVYTYGKTTLAPAERLGYIALSPLMPLEDREALRDGLKNVQIVQYAYPNASTSNAIEDLEHVLIDIKALQNRRDKIYDALTAAGWRVHKPQGTFYMMLKVPDHFASETQLVDQLAEKRVFVMEGSVSDYPGWIRLSLTASDEMVDKAIPIFLSMLSESRNE